jgi:ABC-2 type transport system permease protein
MQKILLLTRREISGYFVSPIAYVAMALFLLASGVFFSLLDFQQGQPAAMQQSFYVMMIVLIFFLPLVTMRALAEEQKSGTIETLLTAPVTDVQVVVSKFLGSWIFFLIMLAPTLLYVLMLAAFGDPDLGPVAGGYLGLALLGAAYVAIGLFASSLTRNQIIAAVISVIVLLLMAWGVPLVGQNAPQPWRGIIQKATMPGHYLDFVQGVVDGVHVIYFVALTVYALFLTVKVLESRRWR